jgi:hypothetical protein
VVRSRWLCGVNLRKQKWHISFWSVRVWGGRKLIFSSGADGGGGGGGG